MNYRTTLAILILTLPVCAGACTSSEDAATPSPFVEEMAPPSEMPPQESPPRMMDPNAAKPIKYVVLLDAPPTDVIIPSTDDVVSPEPEPAMPTGPCAEFFHSTDPDIPNESWAYTYNVLGQLQAKERDHGANGSINERWTYSYSSEGYLVLEEHDHNLDGKTDAFKHYTYTSTGQVVREAYDHDNNGVADEVWSFTYNAQAQMVGRTYTHDGELRSRWILSYDAEGRLHEEAWDLGADATIDTTTLYVYDRGTGHLMAEIEADGVISNTRFFEYDGAGHLVAESLDLETDGGLDVRWYYGYDVRGKRVYEATDDSADAVIDLAVSYSFDAFGSIVSKAYDVNADDVIDAERSYAWDCWR